METMTRKDRIIWAAAVVSARAHFRLDDGEPVMRLVATQPDVLQVAARAMGVDDPVEERDTKGYELELRGDDVHEKVKELWPYLLNNKRRQYKAMRAEYRQEQQEMEPDEVDIEEGGSTADSPE
jgi:hypothetical protein